MLEFESGFTVLVFKGTKSVLIITAEEGGQRVTQEFGFEDFALYVEYLATQVPA